MGLGLAARAGAAGCFSEDCTRGSYPLDRRGARDPRASSGDAGHGLHARGEAGAVQGAAGASASRMQFH